MNAKALKEHSLRLAELVDREEALTAQLDAVRAEMTRTLEAIQTAAGTAAPVSSSAPASRRPDSKKAQVEEFVAGLEAGLEVTPSVVAATYEMSADMASNYLSGIARTGRGLRRVGKGKYITTGGHTTM